MGFIDLADYDKNVHIMMSGSGKADIFAHDTLRKVHDVAIDCVYKIEGKKDFANMVEMSLIQPYTSGRWLFEITYSKVKGMIKANKAVFDSDTSVFMFIVDKYADFKELKELLDKSNDIYTPIIRKQDVYYLLNGYPLSEKVLSFVASSYSREPESIFTLREYLQQGEEVDTQRDVVKLIGVSSGSVTSFIVSLLSGKPKTPRGLKKVIRSRVQMGKDLCDAYGVSSFRNFLSSGLYDMIQIKMLYLNGVVYDNFSNIPDVFDEKKLKKYKFYLERIKTEFSYNDLVFLYNKLQEPENRRWYSVADMARFIYDLYGEVEVDGIVG